MRTLIVFETAEEVLDAVERSIKVKEDTTILPLNAKLVFENDMNTVFLKADGFVLGDAVTGESMVRALVLRAGLDVHIT